MSIEKEEVKGEIEEKYWFPVGGHRYIAKSFFLVVTNSLNLGQAQVIQQRIQSIMYSPSFNGNPMHSPSMMTSTVSQKRLFSPDHQAWPPSSPMQQQQQQQRQDFNANSGHLPEERDNALRPSQVGTTIQSHLSPGIDSMD